MLSHVFYLFVKSKQKQLLTTLLNFFMYQYLIVVFAQIQLLRTDPLNTEHIDNICRQIFSCYGPNLWNSLPEHIETAASIHIFKKLLKHYLFNLAYNQ